MGRMKSVFRGAGYDTEEKYFDEQNRKLMTRLNEPAEKADDEQTPVEVAKPMLIPPPKPTAAPYPPRLLMKKTG
jgi:hypothetical protein